MIYNLSGTLATEAHSVDSETLQTAYDLSGNVVYEAIQPMDWTNIPTQYRTNIEGAIQYVKTHSQGNAYAFPVLTDVHDKFYNEPNYVLYNYPKTFDKFLFLGDIANSYSQAQMDNAVAYMEQAKTVDILALVGNHELGNWAEGNTLPKAWYQPLLPSSCVVMSGDALVYYFDDSDNNVRFICLDSCTPIYQSSGSQLFTKNELEFCASALETAGSKDVIILNHAMGSGFYLVTDTEKTTWKSDTTITNSGTFRAIVNAFQNRETYTLTDDDNVTYSHDFSNTSGDFISYITGHYHGAGNYDGYGFNMLTLPSSYFNASGMSFFVVDRANKKITWLIAYKGESAYGMYEYSYGGE